MATYIETLNYLFNATPVFEHQGNSAYKPGLNTTLALAAHFQHPQHRFRSIHVAGTNGKGSTSHTLAAIFQQAGYKVGLYTSPHIKDFTERIRVNGECISQQYVIDFVEKEKSFFETLHPSFFELTTVLAFKYFAEQKVDIAIIEVGLGGRLDSTNIITPLLSIITNIGLDHTALLGSTYEAIAHEKAGIIKPNVPVVVGEYLPETHRVFCQKAKEMNAKIVFAEDHKEIVSAEKTNDNKWLYTTRSFGKVEGELSGSYQIKNAETVFCALNVLREQGINLPIAAIQQGFSDVIRLTKLSGRWQILQQNPLMICDTGHNSAAWKYLSEQIKSVLCTQKWIVFGMVDDKDITEVMRLLPKDAHYIFTQAQCKRAIPAKEVYKLAQAFNLKGSYTTNVKEAVSMVLKQAHASDFIFIGGSNYIVSELFSPHL